MLHRDLPVHDPRDDPPWAMQLVVRVEKSDPPDHDAVCAAAATAVVTLLTDPRVQDRDGPWRDAVREWEARRIRKVTRRARGTRWEQAVTVPGVTVGAGTGAPGRAAALVHACVPAPVADVPPLIGRLQVAGLDLPAAGEAGPPPSAPYALLALNPDVTISTGKAAAQCGHAAQLLLNALGRRGRRAWIDAGLPVVIAREGSFGAAVRRAEVAVRDGGFTEVPAGTMTAVARLVR